MAETSCSRSFACCAISSSGFCDSWCGTESASRAPGQKFGIRVPGRHPFGYEIQVCIQPWVVLLAMLVSVGPRFASSLYPSSGWQPQQPTSVKSFLPFESSGACESVSSWVWHLLHFDCMNAPLYFLPMTVTSSVSGSFQSWSSSPWRKARCRTPLVWEPSPPWQVVHPNVSGLCALVSSSQRCGCVRKTGFTSKGLVFAASSNAASVSLSVQACETRSSRGFSSPLVASSAGLRETPFHCGFCSVSTAPFASFSTVFVFANQRAFGPQYASASCIHCSHAARGRHSVACAGSIGDGSAGG